MSAGWHKGAEIVRRPVRRAWPNLVVKAGRVVSDGFFRRDALVVAAHADDETLGCGATIAQKRAAGADVRVVIATDGSLSPEHARDRGRLVEQRRDELLRATGVLGVPEANVALLGLPDGELSAHVDELSDCLLPLLLAEDVTHVFGHSRWDPHPDHHAVWSAVSRAVSVVHRQDPDRRIVCYGFPIWDWVHGPFPPSVGTSAWWKAVRLVWDPVSSLLHGRANLVPTSRAMAQKRLALERYLSQVSAWEGGPPSLTAEFVEQLCGPYEVFFPEAG